MIGMMRTHRDNQLIDEGEALRSGNTHVHIVDCEAVQDQLDESVESPNEGSESLRILYAGCTEDRSVHIEMAVSITPLSFEVERRVVMQDIISLSVSSGVSQMNAIVQMQRRISRMRT